MNPKLIEGLIRRFDASIEEADWGQRICKRCGRSWSDQYVSSCTADCKGKVVGIRFLLDKLMELFDDN